MKNTQKGLSTLLGLLLLIIIAGAGLYIYLGKTSKPMSEDIGPSSTTTQNIITNTPKKEKPVACTMDAKQCPDGTYVGRTGANCEFVCPTVKPSEKYDDSPIFECVECQNGKTWFNKPCCTSDFDNNCKLQNGVVRTTDLHPQFTWLKSCFHKASDAGKECSVTSDCLSGVCDLENAITKGKCSLVSKVYTGEENGFSSSQKFYTASYSCQTPKPGVCAETISNRYNPGGVSHTFEMVGKTLIEKVESGPIY